MRDVVRRQAALGVEVPDVLDARRAAQPAHVARGVRAVVDHLRPGVVGQEAEPAREALVPLHLQRVIGGIADRRLRRRHVGAVELRHRPQQPELLDRRPVQLGRPRIGDLPVERVRDRGVQRRAPHRPVLLGQRRQGRDRQEQVRAAAAGVVGFEDRAPADLALHRHVPRVVLGIAVVARQDGAGAEADEGGVALRRAPAAAACRRDRDWSASRSASRWSRA